MGLIVCRSDTQQEGVCVQRNLKFYSGLKFKVYLKYSLKVKVFWVRTNFHDQCKSGNNIWIFSQLKQFFREVKWWKQLTCRCFQAEKLWLCSLEWLSLRQQYVDSRTDPLCLRSVCFHLTSGHQSQEDAGDDIIIKRQKYREYYCRGQETEKRAMVANLGLGLHEVSSLSQSEGEGGCSLFHLRYMHLLAIVRAILLSLTGSMDVSLNRVNIGSDGIFVLAILDMVLSNVSQ